MIFTPTRVIRVLLFLPWKRPTKYKVISIAQVPEISPAFRSKNPVVGLRSNMALNVPMRRAVEFRTRANQGHIEGLRDLKMRGQLCLLGSKLSSISLNQYSRSTKIPNRFLKQPYFLPCQYPGNIGPPSATTAFVKNGTLSLAWFSMASKNMQVSPVIGKVALPVGITILTIWGLAQFEHSSRSICQNKSDSRWKKGGTYYVTTSYVIRFFLYAAVMFKCRTFNPIVPTTEDAQIVKQLLNFFGSISSALAHNCLISWLEYLAEKVLGPKDTNRNTNPVIQFMDRVVYHVMRVVGALLFIDVSGFSIMKWNIAHVFIPVFSMHLCHEVWKQMLKADQSTLTLKGGAADIRNPSTAAEDA